MLSDPLLVGIAHGIVFAVGYFVAKKTLLITVPDGAATLRLVSGFTLGLLLGWLAGGLTAMLAYTLLSPVLQYSVSADSLFIPLIGKSFWFAAIGAGYTAWSIRKQTASAVVKAGRVGKEGSKLGLADNNSYAEAMAEVDEGRIDKGTWARAYAGSGGDESKAKAAYIKSRAVSIHSAAEWSNTLPSDDTQGGRAESPVSNTKAPKAGNLQLTTVWLLGGVAVAGILAEVALPAYQDYSKRRVLAATPVQAPAPQLDLSEFQNAPNSIQAPVPQVEFVPFTGKLDDYKDAVKAIEARDYVRAVNILRPLASGGDAEAQATIGVMYADGKGVAKNVVEGVKWYRLAAAQGEVDGQHNLALMYAMGQGVIKDYVRAHMWFNLSAAAGYQQAGIRRDVIAKAMTPQQIAQAQQMARDCQQRNFQGCD